METVEYVELFWDCPHCGQLHISAVFNSQGNRCPSCFYWRTEAVKLYEASDSQLITDPSLINRPPFWVCKVCEAVNEDVGLSAELLQCSNCNSYQISAVGDITGDSAADQQAPSLSVIGELVQRQSEPPTIAPSRSMDHSPSNGFNPSGNNSRLGWLTAGALGLTVVSGVFWNSAVESVGTKDPTLLKVQVTDLQWTVEVDVQTQKTSTRQGWDESVPTNATILKSIRKQRGVSQKRQGVRTVMVSEQYQSGTRTETYYEPEQYQSGTRTEIYTQPEQYQSGTRTETYYDSEEYQSGTRTETYYDSERYQSGTKSECKVTSQGNGLGKRVCHEIPVYSTRKIPRTRTILIYSTRKIPRTRTVPIFSTRQVKHRREVPVYSTRQVEHTREVPIFSTRVVPVQKPIMATVPVHDTWMTYRVKEWVPQQTHQRVGQDAAERRSIDINLVQLPPQRISATRATCRLSGSYLVKNGWFQKPEAKSGAWNLPCEEYDRLKLGERVQIRLTDANSAQLARSL
ncbi:hypothetical protein H6F90_27595 [Trichocoleus sp. FACHB-591]|uniref:hypothetical protein n=1 Tax=Trichocoleus sp. FACHB-591 TaxID=2692872 RepID=UPI001683B4B7|nr:hypothetical protein [Trichocoleus sp. FACHB-591]MBD2098830.1 hypothetical protein [Trichocoleus sp. FACHB-591]